jgi:MraZ protein
MLLGTYPAKLVVGHRIAVPSQLRRELGEKFILGRWYEGCLVLIDINRWQDLYKRLAGEKSLIVTPIRDTERFILAQSYELTPDDQGRVVVPERLIEYSGLVENVYFVGLGDRVEIWSKERWDEKEEEVIKNASAYIEQLAKKQNG